jgi:tRNA pseudouridine55 synthase
LIFDGLIIVNKPEGWTSHDVVNKMRGIVGTRRVGHLGTLDPIATGVLPLMIGQATKLARFWEKSDKTYEAVVRFGFATTTYDREGDPTTALMDPVISAEILELCLVKFRGEIEQTPPPICAKKVSGVRAYKLNRRSVAVELAPVRVSIYELTVAAIESPRVRLALRCSSGTYVRSIAHELGASLGYGAHLESLVRIRSGPFRIEQSHTLEQLQLLREEGRLEEALVSPTELLPDFPPVFVDDLTVRQIRQGRDFSVSPFRTDSGTKHVKAIGPDGKLIAIGRIALPHVYHPVVVLN